jgi:hypothetical protein
MESAPSPCAEVLHDRFLIYYSSSIASRTAGIDCKYRRLIYDYLDLDP